MKSMKGRIVKTLNSISTIHSLKQGLLFSRSTNHPNQQLEISSPRKESEKDVVQSEQVPGSRTSQSEVTTRDAEDEELDPGKCDHKKAEHFRSPAKPGEDMGSAVHNNEELQLVVETMIDENRKTDSKSGESAVATRQLDESKVMDSYDHSELLSSLQGFEERCPPGGSASVIFYTTSMRGIRKTFEDCTRIRFLLESFRVEYHERDVAMHLEYREELWCVMEQRAVPPRLFIRGRYIGGADEVSGLHERGMLRNLLQGIPLTPNNSACSGCAGVKFVLCFSCNGSRKIFVPEKLLDHDGLVIRCSECNENGLVKCPVCSKL